MSTEITRPEQLLCSIVSVLPGVSAPNYQYAITDKDKIVVATGVSSSESWVRHDAGGYHTKEKFDRLFPNGWQVNFSF